MTAPLVPPEVDLRDFPYMPLEVMRLRDSDMAGVTTGDEFKAAVMLWCAAWHQVPAGSLPSDDRMLARLAGCGMAEWAVVRDAALRNFVECTDKRLYHPLIAEKAIDAWQAKTARQAQTAAATAARKAGKQAKRQDPDLFERDDVRDDQRDEERFVVQVETEKENITTLDTRAKHDLRAIEAQLREAADLVQDPNPTLYDLSPILGLIDAGYEFEAEILPVVRSRRPAHGRLKSWGFFVEAVHDSRVARLRAARARPRDGPRVRSDPDAIRNPIIAAGAKYFE